MTLNCERGSALDGGLRRRFIFDNKLVLESIVIVSLDGEELDQCGVAGEALEGQDVPRSAGFESTGRLRP
jgi:hypothetical protein